MSALQSSAQIIFYTELNMLQIICTTPSDYTILPLCVIQTNSSLPSTENSPNSLSHFISVPINNMVVQIY